MRHGVEWVGECIGAMRLRRAMEACASEDWKADRRAKANEPSTPRTYKPKAQTPACRRVRTVGPNGHGGKRVEVLRLAAKHRLVTIPMVVRALGCARDTARRHLSVACSAGELHRVTPGVYRLAGGSE
jgi:hypothetical protein